MRHTAAVFPLILALSTGAALGETYDFSEAKHILGSMYSQASQDQRRTLYCGCPMEFQNGRPQLADLDACGYQIREDYDRARRIEWEHVVPAHALGGTMRCWKEGGRENCRNSSREFSAMEGDMHNLFPVIGEVNKDRRDFRFELWRGEGILPDADLPPQEDTALIRILKLILKFVVDLMVSMGYQDDAQKLEYYGAKTIAYISDIAGSQSQDSTSGHGTPGASGDTSAPRQSPAAGSPERSATAAAGIHTYGSCGIFIDERHSRIMPPPRSRGTVARAYLYMADRYRLTLPEGEREMFRSWNKSYRPDSWECRRNQLIRERQGNDNPYITAGCSGRF